MKRTAKNKWARDGARFRQKSLKAKQTLLEAAVEYARVLAAHSSYKTLSQEDQIDAVEEIADALKALRDAAIEYEDTVPAMRNC